MISLYRILTYILLPFALFFSVMTLGIFLFAFANPALFLGVFMLAAFVIYFFCTFRFLHKAILKKQVVKQKLRDWIRVNAYVALPFAVLNFMQSSTVIRNPSLVDESIKQMLEMQQKMGMPVQAPGAYNSALITLLYIIAFFSVILLVHIMQTFALIKKHEDLFEPNE